MAETFYERNPEQIILYQIVKFRVENSDNAL